MYDLDAATVMLQWSVGGLFFLWVTGRRREVGIGYGWTIRATFFSIALVSLVLGIRYDTVVVREIATAAMLLAVVAATAVSWQRRKAGVLYQRTQIQQRSERITEMTGIDRDEQRFDASVPEFPASLDLIAPAIGVIGLVASGIAAGEPVWLQLSRILIGSLFLGAVSDAMLLGHWYLTQPGLPRAPLIELVDILTILWIPEVVVMLINPGMIQVLDGTIDDGWGGVLGWFWLACALGTIVLCRVTRAALKERYYSAVMAATGLLYLAIISGFGTDLISRMVLAVAERT